MDRLSVVRTIVTFAIALITVTLVASAQPKTPERLADSGWPMYQHDAAHTGQSPYLGITSSPQVLWKKQLFPPVGESGTEMSMGRDGIVYLAVFGRLVALNPQDGTLKWAIVGGTSRSTPAVAGDGMIYWGFGDSFVAVTTTGEIAWAWESLTGNYVFGSSPVISDDGTIYVTHDGLFAFTPAGPLQWVYPYGWFHHSSPTIGPDGSIYTAAGAHRPDGTLRWNWPAEVNSTSESPSVGADGTIYLGAGPARLFAFYPNGSIKWVFESDEVHDSGSGVYSAPAIGPDGTLYFGVYASGLVANLTHVYAVNPDGSLKWKFPVSCEGMCSPTVLAPVVVDKLSRAFTCANNGSCYGFAPDGTLLWEYVAQPNAWNRTAPLIASSGTILILDGSGVLHCLGDPTLPRLHASPNPFLMAMDYGSSPMTGTFQLTSTLSPITWTATLTLAANWITLPVTTGTTPNVLQIVIESGGLVTGTYDAGLILSAGTDNVANVPLFIPIKVLIRSLRVYLPVIDR